MKKVSILINEKGRYKKVFLVRLYGCTPVSVLTDIYISVFIYIKQFCKYVLEIIDGGGQCFSCFDELLANFDFHKIVNGREVDKVQISYNHTV